MEATAIVCSFGFGCSGSGGAEGAPAAKAGTRAHGDSAGSWDWMAKV
jgi:hypothetical protein